jgi:hypothetical protein
MVPPWQAGGGGSAFAVQVIALVQHAPAQATGPVTVTRVP